ncbi:TPA: hypothetical protein ACRTNY_001360 [Aeromonas hydrophila]
MTDITITDTKEVWVVYTNSDLTEGRGHQYPIHVCGSASTAARMATRKGVQGSDANVSKEIAVRFREPIIQPGLTRTEAEETRARYLRINPGARVTIDSQPDNPQLKTLIAHLPVLPIRQVLAPGFIGYRGWRA